jgi:hypothetical protein
MYILINFMSAKINNHVTFLIASQKIQTYNY